MTPAPTRPEGCLSDFAFDRRLAGELDEAAEKHIAECTRCEKRAAELSAEQAAFQKDAPPLRLPAVAAKRPRFFTPTMIGAIALAAALLLFLKFGDKSVVDDGNRTKGDAAKLGFYVKHGTQVRLGGPDEVVNPGDTLRFVVTVHDPRYMAVLSSDGARHASVYYPSEKSAARVEAGDGVALPQSTALDDTLGAETIYGVFCALPFETEPLRLALEKSPDRVLVAPTGCTVDTLHVKKDTALPP